MAQPQGLRIGRIFGIPIFLDFSWIIIFALITISLGMQFTQLHPQWTSEQHWTVGILTSLLFFGSVLFHELAHSLVALRYRINVVSITLFIFGGLARISRDPSTAIQEFNIAIAGPLASLFLAGAFFLLSMLFPFNEMIGALCKWLWEANLFLLAAFNLVPGFPLDGGRIFRAMVWGITKDFAKATRIAGGSGKIIAYGMIGLGVYIGMVQHDWFSGIWLGFIGWFLLNAAQASVAQVNLREALVGLSAADVMSHEVPTVPSNTSLQEYSSEVLRTGHRAHMATLDGRLVGMMSVGALNTVPREEWPMTSVQAVMQPRDTILWAAPDEPLPKLLDRLLATDVTQMPVVAHNEDGSARIVGIVTRDAILRVLQTRSELGQLTSRS